MFTTSIKRKDKVDCDLETMQHSTSLRVDSVRLTDAASPATDARHCTASAAAAAAAPTTDVAGKGRDRSGVITVSTECLLPAAADILRFFSSVDAIFAQLLSVTSTSRRCHLQTSRVRQLWFVFLRFLIRVSLLISILM